jgi:hypothetical protein
LACQSHLRHVFVKLSSPLAELIPISQTFSAIIIAHDSHVGQFNFLNGSFLTLIARVLLKVEGYHDVFYHANYIKSWSLKASRFIPNTILSWDIDVRKLSMVCCGVAIFN